jgi:hypothetical protein
MKITTYSQFQAVMLQKILPDLMEYLSKEVELTLKKNLNLADISTSTLQDYVTHQIIKKTNGYISDIYIDDVLAQTQTAGEETYGGFTKFISLDGSISFGGNTIVWNMINWLENTGANGNLGNNPIRTIKMFEKTVEEISQKLPILVKNYLRKYGLN